jgi:cobalt-zinc-cadmium efflux system membrane fusion protein
LWAIAEVPEQQAAHVRVGQSVDIEVPALGNARLTGKLIAISDTVNPDTRTVRVRTEVDNHDRHLKPAMLATMLITGVPVNKLAVPASAVVRENNTDHVFVQIGPEQFRLTAVTLGAETGGVREVKQGLKEGEVVVGDGAFHLNNERKRKELEGG